MPALAARGSAIASSSDYAVSHDCSVHDSIEKLDTRLRARNEALVKEVDELKKDVEALKKAAEN